jgi:hypothetical protein
MKKLDDMKEEKRRALLHAPVDLNINGVINALVII